MSEYALESSLSMFDKNDCLMDQIENRKHGFDRLPCDETLAAICCIGFCSIKVFRSSQDTYTLSGQCNIEQQSPENIPDRKFISEVSD